MLFVIVALVGLLAPTGLVLYDTARHPVVAVPVKTPDTGQTREGVPWVRGAAEPCGIG